MACPDCGPHLQRIDWLARYQRVAQRLAQAMPLRCAKLPVAHSAELFGLHWRTVREIDRRRPMQRLSELPPAQPRRLIMDEFALYETGLCERITGAGAGTFCADADRTA